MMTLYIKNMVTAGCVRIVQQKLKESGIMALKVDIGIVHLSHALTDDKRLQLSQVLQSCGMELVDNKVTILVEQIRNTIIKMVHADRLPGINYSAYLASMLNYDYTYLSNTFSSVAGYTIEQFIIFNKIERAKTLLMEGELSLTEIAKKLDYSSSAHLSNQFKAVTGLTPSLFKHLRTQRDSLSI